MPLSPQEQRELDELEFQKLNAEKGAGIAPPEMKATRRRSLVFEPPRMELERELLRTKEGRKRLIEAEGGGILAPRGDIGLAVDIALEGGGATAGQAIGALPILSVPTRGLSIPVGGAIGGVLGNLASQKRRVLAGEQEGILPGQIMSSAVTGGLPGAPLARGAGRGALALEATKQAGAGVAGRTIETVVDEGRLPTGTEVAITAALPAVGGVAAQHMQAANPEIQAAVAAANVGPGATKRATLAAGKEAGYWVVPSDVNQSWINKRFESAAGPADIRRGTALHNQEVTNRIAAVDLGLPENTEITRPVLRAIREEAAEPYRQLAALGAGGDVEALRNAQFTRNENYRHYNSGTGGPDALRRARDAEVEVGDLENRLEATAVTLGRPELVDQMRAGRVRIAKSYDVERALNVGDSGVSAPVLGRAIDKGKALSGGLETIATFAEAFPRAVPEGAMVHPVGLSKTELITGGLLGGGGALATGNPLVSAGLALAPVAISTGARRMVLSQPYQAMVGNLPAPRVDATPDLRALIMRALAQEGSQEIADEIPKK